MFPYLKYLWDVRCGFHTFLHYVNNVKISLPVTVRHDKCVIIQWEFMGKESFNYISLPQIFVDCELCGFTPPYKVKS